MGGVELGSDRIFWFSVLEFKIEFGENQESLLGADLHVLFGYFSSVHIVGELLSACGPSQVTGGL